MNKSIEDIYKGYLKKEFTPTEILNQYLDRINKVDKSLNSFTEIFETKVKKDSKKLDNLFCDEKNISNPLFGIPISLKDIFLVKDSICTCGSKMLKNYVSNYNSTVYEKLNNLNVLLIGKNNMDEFAMGSSTETSFFGPTANPWDQSRVPGGSSGGSAAAVSAGLSCISLGTDTGGSIRQPASFCGVVGMKPTYGRISRFGMIAFSSSLDQAGPITNTVKDSAIVLDAISGFDSKDSTSLNLKPTNSYQSLINDKFSFKDFVFGVPSSLLEEGLDTEVRSRFNELLSSLKSLGAKLIDIELPHAKFSVATYYIIAPSEASSNLSRFDGIRYGFNDNGYENQDLVETYIKNRSLGFGEEVKRRIMLGTYSLSSGYYDAYYLKAIKVKKLIENDFKEVFKKVDAVLTPTCPELPFKLGEKKNDPLQMYLSDILTIPANLAQLPAISIPIGLSSNNLPIGVQLASDKLNENAMMKMAYLIEQEVSFSKTSLNI